MLQSLHVKNLALIQETEVEFGEGLNILTGETGAGKSLLLGSINLALGGKFDKDMLRRGADSALVELVFVSEDPQVTAKMQEMDLIPEEDGAIIISRKLQAGKSSCRINGETVTARQVKELAEVLLDIHGQHEHQSLLHKKNHMEILDSYCGQGSDFRAAADKVAQVYAECRRLRQTIEEESMDETTKAREQALAEFEYQEIEDAKLIVGEDEELEQRYRLMSNSKKITESLAESYRYSGNDSDAGAGSSLSRALRAMRGVTGYDVRLEQLEEQLSQVESLLADYNRDVADYMADCEFVEEDFRTVEERLNTINHLKGKYGRTIEEVLAYGGSRRELLEKLSDYDTYMQGLKQELAEKEAALQDACAVLSGIRQENALELSERLRDALIHLNFLTVEFEIAVRSGQPITAKGSDEVEFMISTNPGESLKSLSQVASGGELSRIMLAIKTVLAGRDAIDTLIFDEIDAGISGRTAWKVSEQLNVVAGQHQVICITHLPQIAAMADTHFMIEKSSTGESTITDIYALEEEQSLSELARLLGSDELSEAALSNAREMKEQANQYKAEGKQ
ncbi:MAG: DNA repair protein RecN [Lachnospiraceae bacterium]|nr:DNA repair protein RecN [Lachnospiraceae bacterium]